LKLQEGEEVEHDEGTKKKKKTRVNLN